MGILSNIFPNLFGKGSATPADHEPAMDLDDWNRIGCAKAQRVCAALEAIIDHGEDVDEDLLEDERSEELADAVLDEVVALNQAGQWQQARSRFTPAHRPFDSHMGDLGLHAVVLLGPERMLVRLGDEVLHIDGEQVVAVEGASMFAISRNRRWLVIAAVEGLTVHHVPDMPAGMLASPQRLIPWPEGVDVDPASVRTLDIVDDGLSVALASDEFGIWFASGDAWTVLAPRPGVGDDNTGDGDEDLAEGADGVQNLGTDACPVYIGSYAQLKSRFGGPLGLDMAHAALSPDGRFIAYGWQDAISGHYVDRVTENSIEPLGRIEARSDYPYCVRFTDDSQKVLSNSRYGVSGITVCVDLASLADGLNEAPHTDEYLRAYGVTLLPGTHFGLEEPVAWIGGAGWSHASPLSGGKPVFTHFLGSALRAFDFDPVCGRVAVASASGVLHVLDPFCEAENGQERGYHPRRELFRWLFWKALDKPVRW